MMKVSAGLSRPSAASKVSRPVILLETLEDRRLMSVGAIQDKGAVRIETNLGRMTFLLTPDVTPITVTNFLRYVEQGLYDSTLIHRTYPLENTTNDIIQGGGYQSSNGYAHVTTFDPIVNEFTNLKPEGSTNQVNVRGTVAMAKTTDPNSATSEWFVNVADNTTALDDTSNSGGFTTFARVIGGGIHVADSIARLPQSDLSSLNSAFTDLPILTTSTGSSFVTVSSAKAQRVLPVTLDSTTRYVTWIDEKGGTATITLSSGTADLTFVGGTNMTYKVQGDRVIVTGTNVDLEQIATHNTNAGSVLTIKSYAGKGPAHIGDISVDGTLGRIQANTVQLEGDIAATGAISQINFQATYRSTISTVGGALDLRIKKAIDTSVNVDGGALKSLTAPLWFEDGQTSTSITAGRIGSMTVHGNFSADITTTGDVGKITINGNVGTLDASTWDIGGSVDSVKAGKVMGLTATIDKALTRFTAREVLAAQNGTGSTSQITAGSIGTMNVASLTIGTAITSHGAIGRIAVSGAIDSSTIRADGNIGSVSAASLTGNYYGVPSAIYAGVDSSASGVITSADQFADDPTPATPVTISRITIGRGASSAVTFSNTSIAAPVVGILDLGKIRVGNGTNNFGVTADLRIGQLTASTTSFKQIALHDARSQVEIDSYFATRQIADDLKQFQVQIV